MGKKYILKNGILKIRKKVNAYDLRYKEVYPTIEEVFYLKERMAFEEIYLEEPCCKPEINKIKAYLYLWCLEEANKKRNLQDDEEKKLIDLAIGELSRKSGFEGESINNVLRGYKNTKGTLLLPTLLTVCNISPMTFQDYVSNYDFCLKSVAKKGLYRKLKDMALFLKEYDVSWDEKNICEYLDAVNYKLECEEEYNNDESTVVENISQDTDYPSEACIMNEVMRIYKKSPKVVIDFIEQYK